MLVSLQLKNFRQHRELEITFTAGLNVIRGANEAGKTTIAEALMYALGGAKALRNPLADTVTWGERETALKVQATLAYGEDHYRFVRSKAGAEVYKNDSEQPYVNGQNEVTAFAASLLGADMKTAANLMMASQNALRGALDQGPKAASEMVESLSEFDFFDVLLERMQAKLVLGSDVSARQRLEEAQARLDNMQLAQLDTSSFKEIIAAADQHIAEREQYLEVFAIPAYEQALKEHDAARANRSTYDMLGNQLKRVQATLLDARTQHIAMTKRAEPVDTSALAGYKAQLEDSQLHERNRAVYEALTHLNERYPEAYWDEGMEALQAEIVAKEQAIEQASAERDSVQEQIRKASDGIQKDLTCKACQQPLKDHEAVAARNAELAAIVEERTTLAKSLGATILELRGELGDLKAVVASAVPFDNFVRTHAQYLDVDTQYVPVKLSWKGAVPGPVQLDTEAIQTEIARIEAADKVAKAAQARLLSLTETIADYSAQAAALALEIEEYPLLNLGEAEQKKFEASSAKGAAENEIYKAQQARQEAQTQIRLAEQSYAQQQAVLADLEQRVTACRREIDDLAFNNALLRKVRAARPMVSDKLWNMVLASVSTFFSQIRKVPSTVTKDAEGFKVNGQSVTSLSGSALDSLGMALRVALVRTFIPTSTFAIFDEPAAAADEDRAQSMIGFLQGAGFAQTLLITHESDSEAVADNLITL